MDRRTQSEKEFYLRQQAAEDETDLHLRQIDNLQSRQGAIAAAALVVFHVLLNSVLYVVSA